MKKAGVTITRTHSKPLLFQSKRLCFSCLYLTFTSIFAFYITLSPSARCALFRFDSFDPIPSPLFSYPSSYAQYKHPLPTFRSSCSSPVFFSDYSTVLEEIGQSLQNLGDLKLSYTKGNGDSFGGNFSFEKRMSLFDQEEERVEFPCGFFKSFPISDHARGEMEQCDGVVVVSAIFGDHDKIRQPKGIGSQTFEITCFFMFVDDITLQGLLHHNMTSKEVKEHKIGAWRLVNVSTEALYKAQAMNGVIPKYLVHRLFPNVKYSIWIDAKLQLVVDPLLLIHSLIMNEDVDMAVSKHPFFVHTMDEAMATARWRKLMDIDGIKRQMESYCENGLRPWSPAKLPYSTDVPDTALILRKHGVTNNLFSCLMFNELDAFNHRDQLAFAFVRDKMKPQIKINMFDVEVFEQVVLEFRHNLQKGGPTTTGLGPAPVPPSKINRANPDLTSGIGLGKCEPYFKEMWGESHS